VKVMLLALPLVGALAGSSAFACGFLQKRFSCCATQSVSTVDGGGDTVYTNVGGGCSDASGVAANAMCTVRGAIWVWDDCPANTAPTPPPAPPQPAMIVIHNNCNKPIWSAVFAEDAVSNGPWNAHGYWNIPAHGSINAAQTYNGNFYVWAKYVDGTGGWFGHDGSWALNGTSLQWTHVQLNASSPTMSYTYCQ
jgi:hypothetical protein